jgi:hypothetical protein
MSEGCFSSDGRWAGRISKIGTTAIAEIAGYVIALKYSPVLIFRGI